jgi:hypothetical protein
LVAEARLVGVPLTAQVIEFKLSPIGSEGLIEQFVIVPE